MKTTVIIIIISVYCEGISYPQKDKHLFSGRNRLKFPSTNIPPKEENLHYSKYLKYETYKRKVTPQRMAQGYEKYSILSNNKITAKSAPEGGKETNTKWSKLKHKF